MSDFLQTFVQISLIIIVIKAAIIGSDFSFYYLFKYKKQYWDWYMNQELFSEYLEKLSKPGKGHVAIRHSEAMPDVWWIYKEGTYRNDADRSNAVSDIEMIDFYKTKSKCYKYMHPGDGSDKLIELGFTVQT